MQWLSPGTDYRLLRTMSYEDMNRHPFVLESFCRETAALTTNGDLSDPDVVLKPMIESFRRQEDQLLKSALERLPDRSKRILETESS